MSAPLTREQLGVLLAAVGNHEAKGLTYLSLEPGREYGMSEVHQLFLSIQGPAPVFEGTVALQQKYCTYSFAPAGLIEISHAPRTGFQRYTRTPSPVAAALVGHLLAATEDQPGSLLGILGKTAQKPESPETAPIRRLELLRALAQSPWPTHVTEVQRRSAVPPMGVSKGLRAFAAAGLLSFASQPTYLMKSRYRAGRDLEHSSGRREPIFYNAVVDVINSLRGPAPGVEIARETIEERLLEDPRWQGRVIRDQLAGTLKRIVQHHDLEALQAYSGPQHTSIAATEEQRRHITDLVDGVDAIAAGDPAAINSRAAAGATIAGDSARVRRLLTKVFSASKLAANAIPMAQKQRLILDLLTVKDGLTTADVAAALRPHLTEALAFGTLNELAKTGSVSSVRQADGPYNRWFLAT